MDTVKVSKKTQEKFNNINLEEFKQYWMLHNDAEVCTKYNLSLKVYKKYCLINNIKKNRNRFIYLQNKVRLERYGDPHYRNREQAKKTLEERYGDPNYHNIEKAIQTNLERYGCQYGFNHIKSKSEEKEE